MESPTNLENLESIAGLPIINVTSSHTSADAPLLNLLGAQFHEMTPEKARAFVEHLRALRKNPQKLTSALQEGATEKKSQRTAAVRKAKVASLVAEY
jgi:hypothetical protein